MNRAVRRKLSDAQTQADKEGRKVRFVKAKNLAGYLSADYEALNIRSGRGDSALHAVMSPAPKKAAPKPKVSVSKGKK